MDCNRTEAADWEAKHKKRGDGLDYEGFAMEVEEWDYLTWGGGISVIVSDLDIRVPLRRG